MPVSLMPILFPLLLVGLPFVFLLRSKRAFLVACAASALVLATSVLYVLAPGWWYRSRAESGDAAAMYELARWTESYTRQLQGFLPWPGETDVVGGYRWLERAAALDYPPAVYALGVRLKQGYGVPRPADWRGPSGNVFPQPARGQPLIDKALRLGYRPRGEEVTFYVREFCR